MYSPQFVRVCGVLCLSLFWYAVLCVPFSCSNHLEEEDFVFIFSSMSCHFIYYVALPHGAMGWSAVCDSGIS